MMLLEPHTDGGQMAGERYRFRPEPEEPVTRPVLYWFGGKWRLAPWICKHLPPHVTYVEPFGGAASVLLNKKRSILEVYNDLDQDVVNLFRVLRSDAAQALIEKIRLTPAARDEFKLAVEQINHNDPITRAWSLIVRSFLGWGTDRLNDPTRSFAISSGVGSHSRVNAWVTYPAALREAVIRLTGTVIENVDALEVIAAHDAPDTCFYLDPPYLPDTRVNGSYKHELSFEQHEELLAVVTCLEGAVVLSGYDHELYTTRLEDWRTVTTTELTALSTKRTETLWLNPRAQYLLGHKPGKLF